MCKVLTMDIKNEFFYISIIFYNFKYLNIINFKCVHCHFSHCTTF